jgi:hypothetical protein
MQYIPLGKEADDNFAKQMTEKGCVTPRPIFMPTTEEGYNDPGFQKRLEEKRLLYGDGNFISKLEDITPDEWAVFQRLPEDLMPRLVYNHLKVLK